jgi:uncharacterized membrane protein (UPF0182 family)
VPTIDHRAPVRALPVEPEPAAAVDALTPMQERRIVVMKSATLFYLGVALTLALPAAAEAQNANQNHPSGNQQQAQQAAARNRDRNCEDLRQRAAKLRDDAAHAKDHGDFAHARDQLDDINDRLTRDCGG